MNPTEYHAHNTFTFSDTQSNRFNSDQPPPLLANRRQRDSTVEFSTPLFDCFAHPEPYCFACWCPCLAHDQIRSFYAPELEINNHCMIALFFMCLCSPAYPCFTALERENFRNALHINGSILFDCVKSYCCLTCVIGQMVVEMRKRQLRAPERQVIK